MTDTIFHTQLSWDTSPETDHSDNEKGALKRERRKSHQTNYPPLYNMSVSQLMIASERQLSCVRRHCLALKKALSERLCLSPIPLAQPTRINLCWWHCPCGVSLRGAPDSTTPCALHVQVLTQKSMSLEHHELLLESNCFINYCLFNFKILIKNLSACLG